jgi:hypothetical protein
MDAKDKEEFFKGKGKDAFFKWAYENELPATSTRFQSFRAAWQHQQAIIDVLELKSQMIEIKVRDALHLANYMMPTASESDVQQYEAARNSVLECLKNE